MKSIRISIGNTSSPLDVDAIAKGRSQNFYVTAYSLLNGEDNSTPLEFADFVKYYENVCEFHGNLVIGKSGSPSNLPITFFGSKDGNTTAISVQTNSTLLIKISFALLSSNMRITVTVYRV